MSTIYTNSTTSLPYWSKSAPSGPSGYRSAKYIIFGKEIEIDGYPDINTSIIVSLINTLGKPYYDDIKKQGVTFDSKIENAMIEHFKIEERDEKINSILMRENNLNKLI